jgi:diguanylate cyclase (GGDEF)-like protein
MNEFPAIPGRSRLLVVDDAPINVQALYEALCGEHQVLVATRGAKALELCRKLQPDLVLLDVEMPDMTGHEVCAQLKADAATRDIPIIFVTARIGTDDEAHVFAIGAVDFIPKPINPAVVRARVRTHLTLKHQSDLLRQMAFVDGLTGVFNRRYFDMRLEQEWARAARGASALALVIADVDCFKAYNDRYGHQAGDDCLRQVARHMKNNLVRPADLVARYGGEEFACILPDTDTEGAIAVAMRLEKAVRSLGVPHAAGACGGIVTISLGVVAAVPTEGEDMQLLIAEADRALYCAKAAGRAGVFAGTAKAFDLARSRMDQGRCESPAGSQPEFHTTVLRRHGLG